jgi:EmrB/QacA subfamily drug resistance transporter
MTSEVGSPDSTGSGVVAAEERPSEFEWTSRHIFALAVLCTAQLFDVLDATIVNVALPSIQHDLAFAEGDLQWVINAYTVLFGGFLLLGGRLGDLLGRRRMLMWGIALFTVASVLSGIAENAEMLIGTRGLQGIGAALISPMTLAMIASIFPEGSPRNRAIAIWGAVTAAGGSLGLVFGGMLVEGPGWRWIFFINIPFGVAMVLLGLRFLPADGARRREERFDVVGAVTSTAGLCVLAYAIAQTSTQSWGDAETIWLFLTGVALLAYFVVHETRISKAPLVPFRLFRNRTVAGANLMQLVIGGAMYALFYFVSIYMQEVLGYSALATGAALIPFTAGILLFAGIGPLLIPRIGTRLVLVIGSLISAGGFVMFANITAEDDLMGNLIIPSVVLSIGLALMFVPITISSVSGVSPSQHGVASGVLNVNRTVGGALGLAVLATIATDRMESSVRSGTDPGVAATEGFRLGYGIAAGLMVFSAVVAILLFRNEGKGEKVDMKALATIGIDK